MDDARRVLPGAGLILQGPQIARVLTVEEVRSLGSFDGDVVDASALVAVPGFIQTHIHLCQTLFRGLADDLELLDWLRLRIFPFEAAHNERSMYTSAMLGVAELIRSGTTTILDMGSIHHEEQVVRAVEESGLRAFVGKALMDINDSYGKLKEPTKDALASARKQAELWHGSSDGRIRYAVAPRFVLSCTDELLHEAYAMTAAFPGMLFHTHAAENRGELAAVRTRCGMDNVEYFESMNILHENTCLAHCIWVNDREMSLLADRKAKVSHCPSSNLKLGSGIARVPEMLARGITVSLGADGAPCNNTLNIFEEMRLAALLQKPLHGPTSMPAKSVFELATRGGAAALGILHEVGSLEAGKKADMVLLDLDTPWLPSTEPGAENIYSTIVYSCSPENVHSVMVNGEWVYRNRSHTRLDAQRLVYDGRNELQALLTRVD
jgi:5-methylthioadenosine/S-adenosylhomocysteine deaminase